MTVPIVDEQNHILSRTWHQYLRVATTFPVNDFTKKILWIRNTSIGQLIISLLTTQISIHLSQLNLQLSSCVKQEYIFGNSLEYTKKFND